MSNIEYSTNIDFSQAPISIAEIEVSLKKYSEVLILSVAQNIAFLPNKMSISVTLSMATLLWFHINKNN